MKITLAQSSGFCFGVRRALTIACNTAKNNKAVYVLGDIVHNEDVVEEIRKKGVRKIKKLAQGKGKILLIRAHGASIRLLANARKCGYTIVDATCPMVKEIHRIAQGMERKGYRIVIIGDEKHDEVQGIIGQLKRRALVIENAHDIPIMRIKRFKKVAVVVQSTQNLETVNGIVASLKQHIRQLKFFNTICNPTRTRQAEIKRLPRENDCIVIIGSKSSANTKRLYEISKSLNPRSYWVRRKNEVKREWFLGARKVGIISGASTPDYITQDTIRFIKRVGVV
jgi:4-hydroxy-3-methylbut-2-enyl diphosphate reductase